MDEDCKLDILKHLHVQQRAELHYRRIREFQIFSWSAAILLGSIVGLLARKADFQTLAQEKVGWRVIASIVIAGLTVFSLAWQLHQRRSAAAHARVLARIAGHLGAFDAAAFDLKEPLYPQIWESWGTRFKTLGSLLLRPSKVLATALLGLIALLTTWLDLML